MNTKEEILITARSYVPLLQYCATSDALKAMQMYADQQLEAYKAKLKAKLDAKLSVSKSDFERPHNDGLFTNYRHNYTMTNVIEQIQNDVAKEFGYSKWYANIPDVHLNLLWQEVCRRFAIECCKATLDKASEKVKLLPHNIVTDEIIENFDIMDVYGDFYMAVDKSTILDKENIVIL